MNISEISIKNPVFAWMLMFALMIFGLLSFKGMGVGQMPDVDFPVLNVNITWEGAAPEVIESDVVDVIEDAVMGVQGLKDISSTSRDGMASITLEFDLERDIDVALQEVQSKISEAQRNLPRDIDPPVIIKTNPEDQPIMWLAVSAKDPKRPLRDLMEFVDTQIEDKFKTIPGVGEIFLGGFVDRNLRVWLDVNKLNAYQLTVADVVNAIQREHVEIPAGRIETLKTETNIRAMGEANSVEEFEKISITTRGGQPIYKPIKLKEVARIEDGLADIRRISRVNGQAAVGLGIRKQRGSNSVAVARNVKKMLEKVQKEIPDTYEIGINFDSTRFIDASVHELIDTLIRSALLTSLVCWFFLGSWSSTFNILLAIPTSILGTFIVLKFMNFTLNTFTLLGLSLAIGIVVDDAIMVLENIVRHREKGESQMEAAINGSKEITFAAIAATLAIIAIFIPVAYMKGIIGKFFFQYGITISAAVALSLLEALTLAPMRCSQMLTVGQRKTFLGRLFESALNGMTHSYEKTLHFTLKYKKSILILAVIIFVASLSLFPKLRKEFVPAQDQSMFLVRLQTPIGSSLDFTNERFKEAEQMLMDDPDVSRYYGAVGGFGGGEVNSGNLFITLKFPKERVVDPELGHKPSQQEIMARYREKFNKIPDVKAIMQDLSMRGFAAQRGFPVEFTVRGPEWEKLVEYANVIMDEMKKSNQFVDVDTDYLAGMPELRIYPNRDNAFDRGVSVDTIANTVNATLGGQRIAKYTKGGKRYDVRVRLEAEQRSKADDLKKLYVWNNRGELVLLNDVIDVEEKSSLLAITRKGRERAIGIFSNVAPGKSQQDAILQAGLIAKKVLPENYRVVFSGTSETFKESFQSLFFALWLGILVSYMVLASQFNHIVHPFTVLLALPFSITGAVLALFICNESLNIYSLIGLILLLGIVKKNSILLVDFTNQMRAQGLNTFDALIKACPMRLRPIIMTSVATIVAAIPPAMALGPGAEIIRPMAIAVIGGVTVSTFLTLFVVPSAYLLLANLEKHKLTTIIKNFVPGFRK